MNTFKLRQAMNSDPVLSRTFGGVYMLNEIPGIGAFTRPRAFIFNTAPPPGDHWICMFFPPDGPAEYFDPAGQSPLFEFIYFLNKHGKNWRRNTHRYQSLDAWTCGQFCIFYLTLRIYKKNPYDFLSSEKLHLNDFFVDDFVTRAFNIRQKYDKDLLKQCNKLYFVFVSNVCSIRNNVN